MNITALLLEKVSLILSRFITFFAANYSYYNLSENEVTIQVNKSMSLIKIIDDDIRNLSSIPSTVPLPESCRDICGRVRHGPCSCDVTCIVYQTCCEDLRYHCPTVLLEARHKFGSFIKVQVEFRDFSYRWWISSCSNDTTTTDVETSSLGNCPTSLDLLNTNNKFGNFECCPVTDASNGLVYKNMETFECNKDEKSVPLEWQYYLKENDLNIPLSSMKSFNDILKYDIWVSPPDAGDNYEKAFHIFGRYDFLNGESLCRLKHRKKPKEFENNLTSVVNLLLTCSADGRHFSYVHYLDQSAKVYPTRFHALRARGRAYLDQCSPYIYNATTHFLSSDYIQIFYYDGYVRLKYNSVTQEMTNLWQGLRCSTGDGTCQIQSCNSDINVIKINGLCVPMFFYYIAFPVGEASLTQHHVDVIVCLMKKQFNIDTEDDWLSSAEVRAQNNITLLVLIFIGRSEHSKPHDLEFLDNLGLLPHLLKAYNKKYQMLHENTNSLVHNFSSEKPITIQISDQTNTNLYENICFLRRLQSVNDVTLNYLFDERTLSTLLCWSSEDSENGLELLPRFLGSVCLNVAHQLELRHEVLFVVGVMTYLILYCYTSNENEDNGAW